MSETARIDALRSIPFFADLSQDQLWRLDKIGRIVSFDAGQPIVEEGEAGDAMYVILGGKAHVHVGGRTHELGPGDFFGEMALLADRRRMATVFADEPVDAIEIFSDAFHQFLMHNPSVAIGMLKAVVERLREVQTRIDAWMATG